MNWNLNKYYKWINALLLKCTKPNNHQTYHKHILIISEQNEMIFKQILIVKQCGTQGVNGGKAFGFADELYK